MKVSSRGNRAIGKGIATIRHRFSHLVAEKAYAVLGRKYWPWQVYYFQRGRTWKRAIPLEILSGKLEGKLPYILQPEPGTRSAVAYPDPRSN
jgi:hypothetical protein